MPSLVEDSGDDNSIPPPERQKQWGEDVRIYTSAPSWAKKIEITNTTPKYIDTIRQKYPIFHRLNKKKFCRNYRNFAALHDLEKYYSGAQQRGSKEEEGK